MNSTRTKMLTMALGLALAMTVSVRGDDVTAGSRAFGFVREAAVPVGYSGLSFPLIEQDVMVATAVGNTAATVVLEADAVGSLLEADAAYYLEVCDGALEGERLDLSTASTIAAGGAVVVVDLSSSSLSTIHELADDALAGARCVVRPHLTLSGLQGMFSPGLTGSNTASKADAVCIYTSSGLTTFYLRADGATWRQVGKTVDVRNRVISPDAGLLMLVRSKAQVWTHAGVVRGNGFRVNLNGGLQPLATGFPVDMTPLQIGAFASESETSSWVGSDDAEVADLIRPFAAGAFGTIYLHADGVTWTTTSDTETDLSDEEIFAVEGMVLVDRTNADGGYLIPAPYSL